MRHVASYKHIMTSSHGKGALEGKQRNFEVGTGTNTISNTDSMILIDDISILIEYWIVWQLSGSEVKL